MMEAKLIQMFLQIINMSITTSYVILTVIVIRLFLQKAPKKYSYVLWSVVGFRLCCPISFQSVFSLFHLKLFDMTKAQKESSAILQYVPSDIGMMAQPEVTVGIPYANSIINGSLPEATPMYSANPMQMWTAIGMYLWCFGMILLMLYSIFSYASLHYRMRTAILLEENVYQSDQVRSPFMLGIVHPKIYIPFGLDGQAYHYVLTHERYHLKRKDHVIKLGAFWLLAIHWFDPLCWLAFTLMSRDMEMSCDEKVLSASENIRKAYSTTLLSFAANRRFPTPSPLAFGETGVKKRIKNVLNWKKPTLWITLPAIMLCGVTLFACATNPKVEENAVNDGAGIINSTQESHIKNADTYVSTKCLFMSPLSSYMPINGDSRFYYYVNDNSFWIARKSNGAIVAGASFMDWEWQDFPYTEEAWKEMFDFGLGGGVDISSYEQRWYLELPDNYHLLKMDQELWVMRTGTHPNGEVFVWDVYVIEPQRKGN